MRNREIEEERIRSLIHGMVAGYEEYRADAFADLYAEDAELTNVVGRTLSGRQAVLGHLRRLFAEPRFLAGRPVGETRSQLRWVTDDVVVVRTYQERAGQQTTSGAVLPTRRTHSLKVLRREDDAWRVVSDFYMDEREDSSLTYEDGSPGDG
ncbi:SgcJ/EcaC family oxidoreductase [Streptomyces bambusae]|uniref:SgcJ/EcaC family oxidoreductase n=1 Tax=Streptomyces bambusae TaxID=1550616 RepID=UPI001CFCA5AF|nr:SgcJ/EcaC family oxidoreductase [Streptomyces bambusae]MCB5164655.1 SgcJ/EcaC family oxidoreductase [Streptomyces bambusae]